MAYGPQAGPLHWWNPPADLPASCSGVYIIPTGPFPAYFGIVMNMSATESPAPRRGRRPSGVPHKPNVAVILHNRLWKALAAYGDGSAVRGLERATAEACSMVRRRKNLVAADADVIRDVGQMAPDAELVPVELPAPATAPPMVRDGPGRPAYRYPQLRARHNLSLHNDVRAQIVLFGGGNFTRGVERVALLVGIDDRRE